MIGHFFTEIFPYIFFAGSLLVAVVFLGLRIWRLIMGRSPSQWMRKRVIIIPCVAVILLCVIMVNNHGFRVFIGEEAIYLLFGLFWVVPLSLLVGGLWDFKNR